MRAEKREWIYAGLSVPPGVALVQRPTGVGLAAGAPRRVLLVGGPWADPLGLHLGRLARGVGSELRVEVLDDPHPRGWYGPRTDLHLQLFRPNVAVLALDPTEDRRAAAALAARVRSRGGRPYWAPPVPQPLPPGLPALPAPAGPQRPSSAAQFAAWAGAVWRSLLGVQPR